MRRCLDSIINNSYPNLEIICVNDGSTDDSLRIIKEYSTSDNRIVVIDKANGGVSSARNAGIDVAHGNFIAFIDADDWIHSRFFERLIKFQQENGYDLTICNYLDVHAYQDDMELEVDGPYTTFCGEDFFGVKVESWMRGYIWGRLYKRELVSNHRFSTEFKIMEDNYFNIEVIAGSPNVQIGLLKESLYYRFNRDNSLSQSLNSNEWVILSEQFIEKSLDIAKNLHGLSRKFMISEAFKKTLRLRYHIMFYPKKDKAHSDVKLLLEREFDYIKNMNEFNLSGKLYYFLLWKVPIIYRAYLIIKDRSMIDWERRRKAAAKSGKFS